jgi:hypothetical protein
MLARRFIRAGCRQPCLHPAGDLKLRLCLNVEPAVAGNHSVITRREAFWASAYGFRFPGSKRASEHCADSRVAGGNGCSLKQFYSQVISHLKWRRFGTASSTAVCLADLTRIRANQNGSDNPLKPHIRDLKHPFHFVTPNGIRAETSVSSGP